MKNLRLSLVLVLLAITVAACVQPQGDPVVIYGKEVRLSSDIVVHHRDQAYLEFHGLTSLYLTDTTPALDPGEFKKIMDSLLPEPQHEDLRSTAFYVQCYVDEFYSGTVSITQENLHGLSVFSFHEDGLRHLYFRRGRDGSLINLPDLDSRLTLPYSSHETIMLHFASFESPPATSGINTFRKALTPEQITLAESWSSDIVESHVVDVIQSDPDLNHGVAYADDKPGPSTCGFRCVTDLPLSACMGDLSGTVWTCQPVDGGPNCVHAQVHEVALASTPEIEMQLPKLRAFRADFLRGGGLSNKYIGYYPLLSRYAKLDAESLTLYLGAIPQMDRVVELLLAEGRLDEIVVTDEFYAAAMELLDHHRDVASPSFQAMIDDIEYDLATTRGLAKSEVVRYANLATMD